MTEKDIDFEKMCSKMIEKQLKRRGIKNKKVLEAFRVVPRHEFVPADKKKFAYEDRPLPIGAGQTISQPYIVAQMIAALDPRAEDKILEVGTGSGYAAAILAQIVDRVYGLERISKLAKKGELNCHKLGYDNVEIKAGDGTTGWPEKSPFSGIIVSAAAPEIPEKLPEQLEEGGILVIPVGSKYSQRLLRIEKKNGNLNQQNLGGVRFVSLIGEDGWSSE